MKLTDEQIDKLFRDSVSKQSFAYKPEYWEEFSASLSDSAPLSEASDDDLDAAFQEGAANQSFEYKPEFWEAFAATLPDNTPLSQAPDDALDAAFQNDASNISVDYKPEFWSEFSDELSSIAATEDVTDAEVDALYREEASKLSFVYHPSYWEEMAALLRRRRRRPELLWFGLSGVFATAIVAMLFIELNPMSAPQAILAWDVVNPMEQVANGTSNNVASNNANGSENDVFQNANDVQNGNNPELNPANNGATPNYVNNGGNPVNNGKNPSNNEGVVNPSIANNPTQANPNNVQNMPRMNRVMPSLVMTTGFVAPTRIAVTNRNANATNDITLNPLSTRPLGNLTTFNNTLADAYSALPQYRGGLMTSMYVQGLGGISQSLITPSDAVGTSYGFGLGIQTHVRNWTFNLGSNLIIENFSDLELTRVAKQYVGFSSSISTQDLRYKNLYTVELDLGFGYNFGRHQFRMGIRPSYTYNARVDYAETNVYNNHGENIQTSEINQSQYGYLEALQLFGLKPTIGYAFNFPSNWTLGFNIGTELRPSINEDFISGVNNRLPFDGQLYIRRTLNFTK